ncbi:hypothetical protein Lnau_2143 [Legionella nautarum]|uniref:Methyltransferase domain-containing protein n=1 Tax=Legionella nautarum TaxID=45070 RepID=A0A0W0WNH7_9GAMM|nr:class I SAM-dependent methyltransferase [Legionella nautarum]KTD33851.1 hypothetical protein Lnau_2143 [Legionella nautarum]
MYESSELAPTHFNFFSPAKHLPPIAEGIFDYKDAFEAFLKATDQKNHTAKIVGAFASNLKKREVLFNDDRIKVADLGCADSTTCMGYLTKMECPGGFDYLGFDINDKFLEEAEAILSRSAVIKKHVLIKKDVLVGELSASHLVSPKSIDLVFVSHLAYYLKDEEYGKQFVKNILNLLNDKGIAIFLHEDSTYYFRSTYNCNYKNSSAPSLLKSSVTGLLKMPEQFNDISFTSKLHFAEMSEELWQAAKDPSLYKKFAYIPSFLDNLNKLSFIVQCDLSKLAHEGSLESFVNEMRHTLETNNYTFNLVTRMQILVTAENSHIEQINLALKETENDVDLIPSISKPASLVN